MRETREDTTLAVVLAIGLHALIAIVVFVGLWWPRTPSSAAAGSPVAAELIDAAALSASTRRALQAEPAPMAEPEPVPEPVEDEQTPVEQPLPEPVPEDAPVPEQATPQDFVPEPDDTDREEVVEAPTERAATEDEAQTAQSLQSQVDLTRAERQEQAQQQRRLTAQQQERERQLAEIRRQRQQASKEASLAEQRLKQIADERARQASGRQSAADTPARAGNDGADTGLLAAYQAALQQAIRAKWTRPETVPLGARCRVRIRQLPGGEVVDAQVEGTCPYDEQGRRSIEAAVLKAQPLPYAGFESVFNRTLILNFEAQDR